MEIRLVIAALHTEGYSLLPAVLLSPTKSTDLTSSKLLGILRATSV